jgi:hypothetical protein
MIAPSLLHRKGKKRRKKKAIDDYIIWGDVFQGLDDEQKPIEAERIWRLLWQLPPWLARASRSKQLTPDFDGSLGSQEGLTIRPSKRTVLP